MIAVHNAGAGQQPGDARQSDIGGGLHEINLVHTLRNAMEIFEFLSIWADFGSDEDALWAGWRWDLMAVGEKLFVWEL